MQDDTSHLAKGRYICTTKFQKGGATFLSARCAGVCVVVYAEKNRNSHNNWPFKRSKRTATLLFLVLLVQQTRRDREIWKHLSVNAFQWSTVESRHFMGLRMTIICAFCLFSAAPTLQTFSYYTLEHLAAYHYLFVANLHKESGISARDVVVCVNYECSC